jgi:hypothetical protein
MRRIRWLTAAGRSTISPPAIPRDRDHFGLRGAYLSLASDLATMEAANEAARRAPNCLLAATGSTAVPAKLWPLAEPKFLKPLREVDRIRFALGQAHQGA